jgi:hypothetical protein
MVITFDDAFLENNYSNSVVSNSFFDHSIEKIVLFKLQYDQKKAISTISKFKKKTIFRANSIAIYRKTHPEMKLAKQIKQSIVHERDTSHYFTTSSWLQLKISATKISKV